MEWFYWLIIGGGILLLLILLRFYFNGPSVSCTVSLKGKLVVFTGCSSGIGKEAAFDLLNKGAEVVFACRDERKTLDIISTIEGIETKSRAKFMKVDMTQFESVIEFAKNFKETYLNRKIDILVNNAGLIIKDFRKTQNNIEASIHTNVIGSIILTDLLIDKMEDQGRIINVSSIAHKDAVVDFDQLENDMNFERLRTSYSSIGIYSLSKLAQIYFAANYSEYCKFNKINVKNFSLHPGVVNTAFFEAFNSNACVCILYYILNPIFWYFTKTPWMGAQTTLQLCYQDYNTLVDGAYYKDCKVCEASSQARDSQKRERFMKYLGNLIYINSNEDSTLLGLRYLNYIRNRSESTPLLNNA